MPQIYFKREANDRLSDIARARRIDCHRDLGGLFVSAEIIQLMPRLGHDSERTDFPAIPSAPPYRISPRISMPNRTTSPRRPARSIMRIVHLRMNERRHVVRGVSGRKAVVVGDDGDRLGDAGGNFTDPRQRRIKAALRQVFLTDELRQRVGGNHEHFIGDQSCPARRRAKADAGEDVGIVALARYESLAVEFYRIEGAAAGEQGAAAGVSIGFLGRAFRLRGRIGERKHDRPLVEPGHGLQHFGRECAANRRDADDRGGLERVDRGQKIADRRLIVRVAKLVPLRRSWLKR